MSATLRNVSLISFPGEKAFIGLSPIADVPCVSLDAVDSVDDVDCVESVGSSPAIKPAMADVFLVSSRVENASLSSSPVDDVSSVDDVFCVSATGDNGTGVSS